MDKILNHINFLEANINALAQFYREPELRQQVDFAKHDLVSRIANGLDSFVALSFSSNHAHIPNVTLTFKIDRHTNELLISANFSSCCCSSVEQLREISRLTDILSGNFNVLNSISPV